jgi:hypothetical protein
MTDSEHAKQIAKSNERELLLEILAFPEGLTDSYYSYFRTAAMKRAEELGLYNPIKKEFP